MELTQEKILENINDPRALEDFYQSNRNVFSTIIKDMYKEDSNIVIKFWYVRLFHKSKEKSKDIKKYIFTAVICFFVWIPVQLFLGWTDLFEYNLEPYLINAIPITFSIGLSLFFIYGAFKLKNVLLCIIPNFIIFCYLLFLPFPNQDSSLGRDLTQSLSNAYYFSFILLWFFVLLSLSGFNIKKLNYNAFLLKCGEIIAWSAIIIFGLFIVCILFVSLFNTIGINANDIIYETFLYFGIVASIFISLLISEYDAKIKLSPIIANIFLPLILVFLIVFGIISIFSSIKPYSNRDIFITYNIMMVIVICVLTFVSINGIKNKFINICSYILPFITLVLNSVTISAVIYRLNEYGISANKIVLLGTNVIMTGHLIFMIYSKVRYKKIERNVKYLPVYFIWALCVVFLFPLIFKIV
ncbi:MAG: hypothetical protein FWB95_05390 [Treponema sp.]|nr:hypothetical protein [Treponema sp.]